jgi:uncharacterized protein involved in outer membrane biogenesis
MPTPGPSPALRKALTVAIASIAFGSLAAFLLVRSVLATDAVRNTLASQLSKGIGQPVAIARIGASIFPRVTINLGGVTIGAPARITVETLQVGTSFRALLSRQIAHAVLRLNGARIQMPLPPFGGGSSSPTSSGAAVELVSIDEIRLNDVEITSGGRTLHADIEAVPKGAGISFQKFALRTDDSHIDVKGTLTDLAGPTADLTISADTLYLDRLATFASGLSGGSGSSAAQGSAPGPSPSAPAGRRPMNVSITLDAPRAMFGAMTLDRLKGRALITDRGMTIDPMSCGVFKGRYDGSLALTLADTPDFQLRATLSKLDVGSAAAFAGSPNLVTGTLDGGIDLAGRGLTAASVARSLHGAITIDMRDGVVKNLGLLSAVVLATSGRPDSVAQLSKGSRDEAFSRLGARLTVVNGIATTNDLRFDSNDLSVVAAGTIAADGSAINLKGQVQLSDALSQQAGRDLVRYTQEQGRVTVPVTVSGSADALHANVDLGNLAKRALRNRANEEIGNAIKRGLGGLLK